MKKRRLSLILASVISKTLVSVSNANAVLGQDINSLDGNVKLE